MNKALTTLDAYGLLDCFRPPQEAVRAMLAASLAEINPEPPGAA